MYERKTKDVQGRRPSNIDLGLFVCPFDVCHRLHNHFPLLTMLQVTSYLVEGRVLYENSCYIHGLVTIKITFIYILEVHANCITSVTNFDVASLRVFKRGVG